MKEHTRWYQIDEAAISSFWDGHGISISRRNVFVVLGERMWSGFLEVIGEPCCQKGIWFWLPDEWSWRLLNGPKWLWADKGRVMYPVHERWVLEHFPQAITESPQQRFQSAIDQVEEQNSPPRSARWCEKCRKYRLFSVVVEPLRTSGRCLYCEIRDELP